MKVRIAGIKRESITDGPGIRGLVFFQGCPHHCPGCHNPHTWDMKGGEEMDVEEVFSILNLSPLVSGITLSGGEPFIQPRVAKSVVDRSHDLGKDVWVYTGFTWGELVQHSNPEIKELLQSCDVLVDGPYVQVKRSPDLLFRGSNNQRIIRVKESLANSSLVLWNENDPG